MSNCVVYRARVVTAVLSLALVTSCAESNAILELTVSYEVTPGERPFSWTQVRRASDFPFVPISDWRSTDDLPPVDLRVTTEDAISVVSAEEVDLVNVRVRFCREESCSMEDVMTTPQLWYTIEHPLYLGKRTSYEIVISSVPAGPPADGFIDMIERCDVRGCVSGDPTGTNCSESGKHFCEE